MKRAFIAALVAVFAFLPASAFAQSEATPQPILLWPHGAPGPHVRAHPEAVRLTEQGEHVVSGVTQPSLTPYFPAQASGAAIIVLPGGGHRELWMDHEGYRVGRWLSAHGVAAFVLKYRLSQEPGSPYELERDSLGDVQRAIRFVRAHAASWGVPPNHVGVMGFSAGGQLAAMAAWRDGAPLLHARGAIDRLNARPDFAVLVYPALPDHGAFARETPPTFLLAGANDRPEIALGAAQLYVALRQAGASAELHILSGAGHGFGLRDSNPSNVARWPSLLHDWLDASGFLNSASP